MVFRSRSGAGSIPLRLRMIAIVLEDRSCPRLAKAPRIRSVTPVSVFLGHPEDKSFEFGARSWSPRLTTSTPVVLIGDQLSMPCKQRLRRDDVRDLGQSTSAQFFRADSKPSPLIVGKVESPVTDLFTKDAILFGEVVDHDLLMLIEPASEASKKERKRINQRRHGQMLSPGLVSSWSAFFNAFEFLHLT